MATKRFLSKILHVSLILIYFLMYEQNIRHLKNFNVAWSKKMVEQVRHLLPNLTMEANPRTHTVEEDSNSCKLSSWVHTEAQKNWGSPKRPQGKPSWRSHKACFQVHSKGTGTSSPTLAGQAARY